MHNTEMRLMPHIISNDVIYKTLFSYIYEAGPSFFIDANHISIGVVFTFKMT